MAHTLPARPSFLPNPPEPIIPADIPDPEPVAGPSTSQSTSHTEAISTTSCAICSNEPKYTCPGCTRRTCSLACSKEHKVKFECDGKRDATAFVPLKEVGHGTWADDYRWLEEGRRRIASWGEGIPRGAVDVRGRGGARGRGRGRGGASGPPVDGRAIGLGRELEKMGIGAQFMPEGMERRKRNQSSWNPRNQTLFLTVQLSVPQSVVVGEEGSGTKMINHSRVAITPSETKVTLQSLLPPLEDSVKMEDLVYALPYHSLDPQPVAAAKGQRFFPLLDPSLPLAEAFRGTAFVEYPTVHVLQKAEWETRVNGGEVSILPFHQTREPVTGSKRKADDLEAPAVKDARQPLPTAPPAPPAPTAPPKPALGLGLGDYASDGEDSAEEAVEEATDITT